MTEEKSLNFIEEIVEEDLSKGKYQKKKPGFHLNPMISAYGARKKYLPEFRIGSEIWGNNKSEIYDTNP